MEDETIVDTEKAVQEWAEKTDWNGNNHIGRSSGSQWRHQSLYRSSKGRYYLYFISDVQSEKDYVQFLGLKEAAGWLLLNAYELPEDLKEYEEGIVE